MGNKYQVPRGLVRTQMADEQLAELEELWLGKIAVAEIRSLRGDVDGTHRGRLNDILVMQADVDELREALKKYGKHGVPCPWHAKQEDGTCTCGLETELKGGATDEH